MTLTRLLAAALVLCSLPVFAQDQGPFKQGVMARGSWFFFKVDTAPTPAEPWRIIPPEPAGLYSGHNPLSRFRVDQWKVYDDISNHDTEPPTNLRRLYNQGRPQQDADFACYAIRSYLVARDSKNSDSTHPVSYSTCQPAARYQLRTTEIRSGSADR